MKIVDPLAILKSRLNTCTQAELARQAGISPGYINDVLHGRKTASERLLTLLGVRRVYVLDTQRPKP